MSPARRFHELNQSTGTATSFGRFDEPYFRSYPVTRWQWIVVCQTHATYTTVRTLDAATKEARHPELFCPACAADIDPARRFYLRVQGAGRYLRYTVVERTPTERGYTECSHRTFQDRAKAIADIAERRAAV